MVHFCWSFCEKNPYNLFGESYAIHLLTVMKTAIALILVSNTTKVTTQFFLSYHRICFNIYVAFWWFDQCFLILIISYKFSLNNSFWILNLGHASEHMYLPGYCYDCVYQKATRSWGPCRGPIAPAGLAATAVDAPLCPTNCFTKIDRNGGNQAHSRFVASQCETSLLCNDVTHWLATNLESNTTIQYGPWIDS